MANFPPPPPKRFSKSIVIAIAIIIVLAIALVGVLILNQPFKNPNPSVTSTPSATPYATQYNPNPTATFNPTPIKTPTPYSTPHSTVAPYDFKISAGDSVRVLQGGAFSRQIDLTTTSGDQQNVNSRDIAFTGDSGSSGIQFDFDMIAIWISGSQQKGFSSLLTISVPDSTPTNSYSVIITATYGGVSHSTSLTILVMSKSVTVSGMINSGDSGVIATQIKFVELSSRMTEYTATITNNSFSTSLPNNVIYQVAIGDGSGTFYSAGQYYLDVPAGSNSITKNFTVFGNG